MIIYTSMKSWKGYNYYHCCLCVCVCLSLCPSVCLSFCLSVRLSVCLLVNKISANIGTDKTRSTDARNQTLDSQIQSLTLYRPMIFANELKKIPDFSVVYSKREKKTQL